MRVDYGSYNASAETVVDKKKKRRRNEETRWKSRTKSRYTRYASKGFRDRWTINKRSLLSPWIVRFDSRVTNRADNEGGGVKKRGREKKESKIEERRKGTRLFPRGS